MDNPTTTQTEPPIAPEKPAFSTSAPVDEQTIKNEIESLFGPMATPTVTEPSTAEAVESTLETVETDLAKLEATLQEAMTESEAGSVEEVQPTAHDSEPQSEAIAETAVEPTPEIESPVTTIEQPSPVSSTPVPHPPMTAAEVSSAEASEAQHKGTSWWRLPFHALYALARILVTILVILDWPFRQMSGGKKTVLGYAGMGTTIVAAATWIARRHLTHT